MGGGPGGDGQTAGVGDVIGKFCETCGCLTLPRESDNRCLWCLQVIGEERDPRGQVLERLRSARLSEKPSGQYQANHPWRARRAARLG